MRAWRIIKDLCLAGATLLLVTLAAFAFHFDAGVITITSGSMAPTLRTGDTAITIQEPREEVVEGDIVVLPHPTDPAFKFAHRIVEIDRKDSRVIVQTKGDANPAQDAWRLEIASADVPKVVLMFPTSQLPFTLKERTYLAFTLLAFALLAIVISLRRFRDQEDLGARLGQGGRSD